MSSQQLREVSLSQANQSEAVRVLTEDKIMLEKKLDGLRVRMTRCSTRQAPSVADHPLIPATDRSLGGPLAPSSRLWPESS